MTVMPKVVLDQWQKFKRVTIRASVVDLGDRNHYIRYPSEWSVVCDNLRKARQAGAQIIIVQTVNAMNMYYLDDFQHWAHREGYTVAYNFMRQPSYLMPEAIPSAVRSGMLRKLKKGMTKSRFSEVERLYASDENMSDSASQGGEKVDAAAMPSNKNDTISKDGNLDNLEEADKRWSNFVRYTRFLDGSREQSFQKVFPEFSKLLAEKGVEVP